jgi:hypothetical protein
MPRAAHLFALVTGVIAMTAAHAAAPGGPLIGQWGGQGVRASFTAAGADIDYDCGTARIAAPVVADARGHFSAQAMLTQWQGGPQPADAPPPPGKPVTISGTIDGAMLMLDLHTAGEPAPAHFALRAGAHGKVIRCY